MKEFAYDDIVNLNESKKVVRKLIYTFFKGNIQKKKVFIDGVLKDKTFFSFKRPFGTDQTSNYTPSALTDLFPNEKLFVIRHYNYKESDLPLFLVESNILKKDLENLDLICNYEYSYIFDINFSYCFFVTDSCTLVEKRHIAILQLYKPL